MKRRILALAVCIVAVGIFAGCQRGGGGRTLGATPRAGTVRAGQSGMQMAWIPAGTFTMGSPANEPGHAQMAEWGLPETQHQVRLTQGFWMGRTTVTRGQWRAVTGVRVPSEWAVGGDNLPATHVSWYDAIVFANRLSMQAGLSPAYEMETTNPGIWSTNPDYWGTVPTGNNARWNAVRIVSGSTGYRLPTEAQWEYAARAGTTTAFNDGVTNDYNNTEAVRLLGWFFGAPGGDFLREVGQLRPNAWGLYDMHGNVWEWAWDWWQDDLGSAARTDPLGASSGSGRVCRGGSWSDVARFARSAVRFWNDPSVRNDFLGFRVSRP